MEKFCAFILAHGRPEKCDTYNKLRAAGYTGRIIIVIDNEDNTANRYYEIFGKENVFCFNKTWSAQKCDAMNNFGNKKAILFARNECFIIAKELGFDYFVELDDDYYYFGHRGIYGACKTSHLDEVFKNFIEFLLNTNCKSIAFSQGGDHIGGWNEKVICKRKSMNSFFCITNRPFKFFGVMNDDVNCYLINGKVGDVFLTYNNFQLDQVDTQSIEGGMTDMYKNIGTYTKSFTSVMSCPSNVRIKLMGCNAMRLHHSINWDTSVPMIISQSYKK